jgi:hypothetical protein
MNSTTGIRRWGLSMLLGMFGMLALLAFLGYKLITVSVAMAGHVQFPKHATTEETTGAN